jgi:predicted phosphodiesterase
MGKIYVTGDIHGDYEVDKVFKWAEKECPTKNDYLIITGDFGLVFYGKYAKKYKEKELPMLKKLNDMPFTTLFVDGNHENFDRLYDTNEFPVEEWNGGSIARIMPNVIHLKRGQVFEINGNKFFTLGGALSLDRELRKPHISWWSQELLSYEELNLSFENLKKHNRKIDYVITHAGPRFFAKKIFESLNLPFFAHDNTEIELEELLRKVEYKHWYCGHYHYDFTYGNISTLYNNFVKIGEV